MGRPYGLLRAGFPYLKTLAMRRVTNFPVDLALGQEGRIYVLCRTEAASEIRTITLEDENLGAFGSIGTGEGQFQWPTGLAVDRDETIYVSDEARHTIYRYTHEGDFLGQWGERGDGDGELDRPSGIAFDSEDNLYVSDTMNHRVQKFTRDGKFLMSWGSFGEAEGQLNMPWGVTVDELGDVYVVDWRNDRVQKFSGSGEFVFSIGSSGAGDGEFNRPTGVEVDLHGDIYVADAGNNRVQLFDPEGAYVQKFLGEGTLSKSGRTYMLANARPMRLRAMGDLDQTKLLRGPRAVRVDDQFRMYIPDYGTYRVQVYQKEAVPLDENQISPPLRSPSLQTT
jgi:DNA-binding beta-propeller fold protein YncE